MKKPKPTSGRKTRAQLEEEELEEKYKEYRAKQRQYKDHRVGSGSNPDRHKDKERKHRNRVVVCTDCGQYFSKG